MNCGHHHSQFINGVCLTCLQNGQVIVMTAPPASEQPPRPLVLDEPLYDYIGKRKRQTTQEAAVLAELRAWADYVYKKELAAPTLEESLGYRDMSVALSARITQIENLLEDD